MDCRAPHRVNAVLDIGATVMATVVAGPAVGRGLVAVARYPVVLRDLDAIGGLVIAVMGPEGVRDLGMRDR